MKKKKLLFLSGSIFSLAISLFTLNAIRNVDVSYAIPTDANGVPTADFTTNSNFNNPQKINLVGDALGSSSYSNGYKQSFEAVKNLKDRDGTFPLYVLSKNKYTPSTNETFGVGSEANNPVNITDAGLKRIIKYGYNNYNNAASVFNNQTFISNYGNVSSDNDKQYITQLAIWLYLYNHEGTFSGSYCANNGCKFLDNSNPDSPVVISYNDVITGLNYAKSQNRNLGYVSELLTLAETQESNAVVCNYSDNLKDYTFNDNKSYILSGPFKLTNINSSKFISWSVEVLDRENYGLSIVDNDGNSISNLNNLSKDQIIRVKIPVTGDMSEKDFSGSGIKVTVNSFLESDGYPIVKDYRVTETSNGDILLGSGGTKIERFSNVMLGLTKGNPVSTLYYLKNFTIISKVDATNGDEIGGATLEIYNNSDMINNGSAHRDGATAIESWTSVAGESHRFYLEDGTYGLCESGYPDGYGYNEAGDRDITTCITFVVNNGSVTVKQMDNYPVPNTGLFSSKTTYTVGGALIIIGILGMVIVLGKDKKKQQIQSEQEQQSV